MLPAGPSGALGDIEVPFVVVQNAGYLNLHQFGAYDLFENAGTPKDRRWLIVGPATYDLPVYLWQLEALAFFDHLVYGADNGYAAQPRCDTGRKGQRTIAALWTGRCPAALRSASTRPPTAPTPKPIASTARRARPGRTDGRRCRWAPS